MALGYRIAAGVVLVVGPAVVSGLRAGARAGRTRPGLRDGRHPTDGAGPGQPGAPEP